ncbi:MAG TPA: hypothetical protein VJT49_14580 [Amycolatopsis sp.]|uniref:hypothetical protein n=1 Tax=Amycolatopsis sp. TaxID=37632 RepID=UPI002B4697C6|nr:hypothetical protein [Amycolatopsis sp.]HKS46305.1 hypothetical protein [Amycolatopsis sp.]
MDTGPEIDTPVPAQRSEARQPLLEPLDRLQWSQAIELPRDATSASKPSEMRRAWIHRAPEREVVALFRAVRSDGEQPIPAPWWLRALADGRLDSRDTGFRVEDRMTQLLSRRPGWEYVPWAADGESGYWEFMPSERGRSGHRIPTTILNTSRHDGWIDVLPAHSGITPEPIAVAGLAGLRSRLGEFEAVR